MLSSSYQLYTMWPFQKLGESKFSTFFQGVISQISFKIYKATTSYKSSSSISSNLSSGEKRPLLVGGLEGSLEDGDGESSRDGLDVGDIARPIRILLS